MTTKTTPHKQEFFNNIAKEFDTHVRQSIPLYGNFINHIRENIIKHYNHASVLDLCGSTGLFGKNLFEEGFNGEYWNIDGSPKMIEISKYFAANLPNKKYFPVLGGFMAEWTDEDGTHIPLKDTKGGEFDIICEFLGFQFFTKSRIPEIVEVKKSLSENGIFICCEKFSTIFPNEWIKNEQVKDEFWKSQFFTPKEIEAKKANVLEDMNEYLCEYSRFENILQDNFNHVYLIYHAGNFRGYMASDTPIKNWSRQKELLRNIYNA